MAVEYKHKEYFRRRLEDSSLYTFTSVADGQTKCAFHNTFLTDQTPTVTYALEDSDQTLVVTFEFADSDKQEAWKTAVDNLTDSSTAWYEDKIEWFKIEWLHQEGSVSSTTNL
jgi:hypothetical protein|tara:strand:+ start:450 stop:788 length:339 start_codon:yes stop_codon:yes gene_type:complete